MAAIGTFKNLMRALIFSTICCTGLVFANDCQIQVSQPTVDYGSLNPDMIRAGAKNSKTALLDKHYIQLYILCSEDRAMTIGFHAITADNESYQLGELGNFELTVKDAQLDGASVLLGTVSKVGDVPMVSEQELKLTPGKYIVPVASHQLMSGKSLSLKVEVNSRLATEKLKIRDLTYLKGNGYFELY